VHGGVKLLNKRHLFLLMVYLKIGLCVL